MVPGILGKKIGMTQIFREDGVKVPVTVLEVGPCQVQAVKSGEKDGYVAVQLGYDDVREKRVKKPQRAYLKSKNLKTKRFVREIRCAEAPEVKVGQEITGSVIQLGDFLDVTGTSKGKGFQGGVKRCGWAGGKETHGSMTHRAPGSMGASSYPSRVMKGHGGAGQMGNEKVTVQNLEVVEIDRDNNTVAVRGAVPGANGTYLIIRYARKKELAPREEAPEETEEQPGEAAEKSGDAKPAEEGGEQQEPVKEKAEQPKKEEPVKEAAENVKEEEAGKKTDDENKG